MGWSLKTAAVLGFFGVLTAASLTDLKSRKIPNVLVLLAAVMGLFLAPAFPEIGWMARIIGFLLSGLLLILINLAAPGSFGGGDVKLMAVCGFFLGWRRSLVAFAAAMLAGGLYIGGLFLLRKTDRKAGIPLAPFLCLGTVVAFLWGNPILAWYLGH